MPRPSPAVARLAAAVVLALLAMLSVPTFAEDFAMPGGPPPGNLASIAEALHRDPYAMELLISYGTSKGGSAGHLALALREEGGDDSVWSANFYADRSEKHAAGFYTDDLMVRVPKLEYLYGTRSSLGETASFGLDFGEIYKRSVVGVRVYGVPLAERQALAAYFHRINDDYRRQARRTEYHDDEIHYDYFHLNCAKTIGSAFKYGAHYADLPIAQSRLSPRRKIASALNANVPAEMAMNLIEEWNARGYAMDVVLYRKYPGSSYVDPHDDEPVAFKDLPDRFPSVLSRDFRREAGEYEDFDNLYAMYLLYELGRFRVEVDGTTKRLEITVVKSPTPYARASERAREAAEADSRGFGRRLPFARKGTPIGER